MPKTILVDTNVWIDNYCGARPGAVGSRAFIDAACALDAQLCYPVHILKDVFYSIGATLKHMAVQSGQTLSEEHARAICDVVWGCIDNMCELAAAVGADESDAWRARKYRSLSNDLEDNFVLAAAERAHVDFIVTRDERLLRRSSMPAFTPEDAVAYLAMNKEGQSLPVR